MPRRKLATSKRPSRPRPNATARTAEPTAPATTSTPSTRQSTAAPLQGPAAQLPTPQCRGSGSLVQQNADCCQCQRYLSSTTPKVFVSRINIEELLIPETNDAKANKTKNPKKEEFKKLFCALLNCLDGNVVIFHVKNTRILDTYDSKWNYTLMKFVPDNACYHDVFERVILDEKHFRVRVKPRKDKEQGVMSTFCFHSSLSMDKGLDNHPSHQYMQRVLENARDDHGYCNKMHFNLPDYNSFKLGTEVKLVGDPDGSVPFQECMWLQAKGIKKQLQPKKLVDMMWGPKEEKKHDLGKYISAFSKVSKGGIIYFGICEKPEGDNKPTLKKFSSEGVFLDQQNCELKQYFNEKMENLLWVRAPSKSDNDQSENSPVFAGSVDILPLSEGPHRRCIIKITVNQFQGVCFFRKEGPESYVLGADDNPEPVQDWAHWAAQSHCEDFVPVDVQFHWKF